MSQQNCYFGLTCAGDGNSLPRHRRKPSSSDSAGATAFRPAGTTRGSNRFPQGSLWR